MVCTSSISTGSGWARMARGVRENEERNETSIIQTDSSSSIAFEFKTFKAAYDHGPSSHFDSVFEVDIVNVRAVVECMSSQVTTAFTHSSRCARSLLSALLQSLQERRSPLPPNAILLFALAPSPTTPPEVLSDITSALTRHFPEHVGCISAPLPSYPGQRSPSGPHSCSLAYALVNGVSFHSTISGCAEVQVGRWHAARQRSDSVDGDEARVGAEVSQMQIIDEHSESSGQVDWEGVWDRAANSVVSGRGNGLESEVLPDVLRNLDPSAIDTIIYFSDKAPKGFSTLLESTFKQANKLSLIASSTPFITGRPVTLFHNGSILSSGAVGVAFSSSPSSPPPVVELLLPPLVALSTNLNITSSEGNLILSLDCENPTKLLLAAIRRHGLSSSHEWVGKEDAFYIGVIDPSSQQISQIHRINAGDPSRGALVLDAALAPIKGSVVRLYYLPGNPANDSPKFVSGTNKKEIEISLFVAPEMIPAENFHGVEVDNDHMVVSNSFLAASENGFTLSRGTEGRWKCVIPGARTGLSWSR